MGNNFTDDSGTQSGGLNALHDGFRIFRTNQRDHADPAVEDAPHLFFVNVALRLYPVEQLRARPAFEVDLRGQAFRQDARNIFGQAAARNVGQRQDRPGIDGFPQVRFVDRGGLQQRFQSVRVLRRRLQQAVDEREAVGVHTAGVHSDQDISRLDIRTGQQAVAFCETDAESGEVVVAGTVEPGHFGRFSAEQDAAGLLASCRDPADHVFRFPHVQGPAGVVVEKQQGARAVRQDIVRAHGHEVDADGFVLLEFLGQEQFGADSVRPADQHGLRIILRQLVESAESAEIAQDLFVEGLLRKRCEAFHQAVAGVDVDPGLPVGGSGRFFFWHGTARYARHFTPALKYWGKPMIQHIPNLISVLRLLLVPWFAMLLLEQQFGLALILFIVMGISDGLDGFLARHLKATSALGSGLDPLADKVMLVAAFVILGHLELLSVWLVALVVGRDVMVVGGTLMNYLLHPGQKTAVLKVGKINTFVQIITVFAFMGNQLTVLPPMLLDILLWATVIATFVSGVGYMLVWGGLLADPGDASR